MSDKFDEMASSYFDDCDQYMHRRVAALVRREVEECCMAVCEHCRAGNKPKALKDYGTATPFVHLFQGYPPRTCFAAAIRARAAKEGK